MQKLFTIILMLVLFQANAQDTSKVISLGDVVVTGVRADSKTPVSKKTINKSFGEKRINKNTFAR